MPLPPLLRLPDKTAYWKHYKKHYLRPGCITTFDGIRVQFFDHNFTHAFFTESKRGSGIKDRFDRNRAERMDWIAYVLQDATAELYERIMPNRKRRRIALMPAERYAVIIQVERDPTRANFITAYVVNSDSALRKMRSNPRWNK